MAEENEDLKMMRDPNSWPNYPLLPVKMYYANWKGPHFGTVLFLQEKGYILIKAGVHDPLPDLAKADKEETTPEKLVAEGWVVD